MLSILWTQLYPFWGNILEKIENFIKKTNFKVFSSIFEISDAPTSPRFSYKIPKLATMVN